MQVFEKAKWIWLDKIGGENEYAEFFTQFDCDGTPALCRLSCDGDYTLFVNGEYVASNQYGDFEHFKIYDELDISACLRKGKNSVAILVWHFGQSTQRYILAQAGLIFEIIQNGIACVNSGEETLCRKSKTYDSTCKKTISPQLGFSFAYDATKEDEWMNTGNGFDKAVLVGKICAFYPRPNQKLVLLPRVETEVLKSEGNYYLIDLKKETVGLPSLAFYSPCAQKVRVDFGEDLQDGHVRRLIGNRDFSFDYVAKEGENEYVNYMLRLGCRYLEVYAESPIEIRYVGVIPQVYPAVAKTVRLSDPIEQKIYDTCLETLKLCMMEHYVDCPWREQCLYAFDSRNQMLCGYYAFENGNAEYARSNLKLMSEDRREDKLLAITYPCGVDLTIPSFSLYYYMAVREYVEHTGDVAFAKEVYPKLASVLSAFMENRKDGLLCKFSGSNHWNFYDWSDYLDGNLLESEEPVPDLMANLLFIIALENLKKRCARGVLSSRYGFLLNVPRWERIHRFGQLVGNPCGRGNGRGSNSHLRCFGKRGIERVLVERKNFQVRRFVGGG